MRKRRNSGQIAVGVSFIAAGVALMLNNFDILALGDVWRYWPLALVAMGVGKLLDGPVKRRLDGTWLIMVGSWLQLNMLEILAWEDSWPLMIVAAGINLVLRALAGIDRREARLAANGNTEARHD